MKKLSYLLLLIFSLSVVSLRAQNHWTVSGSYRDQGVVYAEIVNNENAPADFYEVGAFIDGECRMILCQDGKDEIIGKTPVNGVVTVSVVVDGLNTKVLCDSKELGEASVANLSTEVAGGFVGCCIGIYASANGKDSDTYVTFKDLTYTAG